MGPRGDAIAQLDWCTGRVNKTPDRTLIANALYHQRRNCIVEFTKT